MVKRYHSQTSERMVPFIGTELNITLRQLISVIVRRKVVTKADTPYLLMKVDSEKKENLVHLYNLELGSTITSVLAKVCVKYGVKMKI